MANGDTITGLSGRTLKLSSFMKANNISSEYRLGLKNLMSIYPSRVRDKILADAKAKTWDEHNKKAIADVARELSDFDGKNSSESPIVGEFVQLNQIFYFRRYQQSQFKR